MKFKQTKYYHAAWDKHLDSILEFGLRPGPDGCVYMAGPEPAHAAQFLALRGGPTNWELNEEGKMWPVQEKADKIYVFTIYIDDLDMDKLHESFDHNANFFPPETEAVYYDDAIPPECCNLEWEFDLNSA
tara:strand:+ start:2391 stop:2780 length:390 start_codon:yes stop_codon:yes gene_type:complete